jgi:transposase
MPSPADTVSKNKASELIRSHWRPEAIARKVHCHPSTLYKWENRMQMYGTIDRPLHLRLPTGRPRLIHSAAVESLLKYRRQNHWVYQDEMVIFLEEEWGIIVDWSTISRLLKKHRISNKKGQRLGRTQSQAPSIVGHGKGVEVVRRPRTTTVASATITKKLIQDQHMT